MTNSLPKQEFIQKLREIVEANLSDERFGVNELAKATGLNYFSLNRRLHSVIRKTTSQFICEIRLEKAKEILELEEITVSEVAYRVGFSSPAYFNRCFHEHFGYPPGEIKKRGSTDHKETSNVTSLTSLKEEEAPKNFQEQNTIKEKPGRKGIALLFAGMLLLAILASFYFFRIFNQSLPKINPEDKSIAVLPFKNLSDNEENQYFADGIMEDILNLLYRVGEFRVVSRTSAEQFRGSSKTAPEIARTLGVNFILEGSVQRYENKVRVNIQLIDARHDRQILSEKYDREFADIFAIQSGIAKQVADQLQTALSSNEIKEIEKIPTQNTEAYNLYLKGRFFWNKRTEEGVKKSIEYFEKAVESDPDYALAWVGLAGGYHILSGYGWYKPKKEGQAKAKSYTLKALELDKNLAEAHTQLGFILGYVEWKWDEAIREVTLAIRLNPNYAFAHQIYAQLLDVTGDYKKAREEIDIALKLEPSTLIMHTISATMYYNEKNFDAALMELIDCHSIEKNSEWPYFISFKIYYRQGNGKEALNELKNLLLLDTLTSKYVFVIDSVFTKSGLNGLMDWIINVAPTIPKVSRALDLSDFYAITGQKDEAFSCLEKYQENSPGDPLVRLINHLDYESLRSEPRFKAVVDKLGLTEYYLKRAKDPDYIKK